MTFTHPIRFPRVRSFTLVAVLTAFALLVAACGGQNDDDDHNPDELIAGAAERFDSLETVRYTLELADPVPLDEREMFILRGADGAVARPGSATAETRVSVAGASVVLELIAIEGEMYLRNVLTGQWERAPVDLQYDPAIIFSEGHGIASVLQLIEDRQLDGAETVGGVSTVKVTGTVPTSAVRRMTGDVFDDDSLFVTLWIDPEDHDVHRIQLEDTAGAEVVSWALSLTDHDEPVEITAPEID